MRKLLLSTAILGATALAAPTLAQDMFRVPGDAADVRGTDLIGMRVYASEAAVDADEYEGPQEGWEDIGEVNDILVSREGDVDAVLVDIGGFLGIGERQVAVDMSQLRFLSDSATADDMGDFFLVLNADRATLEGAPDYMAGAMGDGAAMTDDAMTDDAMTDDAMADDVAATGAATTAAAVEEASEATSDVDATAADATAMATEENADAMAADATADATTETEMAADDTAAAATDDAAADEMVTDDMAADMTTDGVVTDDMAATDAATDARMPLEREGYLAADAGMLTADNLQGAAVYDSNDERIGEVSELLLSDAGQVDNVVIDVGGFLGIGEKPVSMAMGDIDILQQDGGGEIRVYLSETKEQLEAMPSYEN